MCFPGRKSISRGYNFCCIKVKQNAKTCIREVDFYEEQPSSVQTSCLRAQERGVWQRLSNISLGIWCSHLKPQFMISWESYWEVLAWMMYRQNSQKLYSISAGAECREMSFECVLDVSGVVVGLKTLNYTHLNHIVKLDHSHLGFTC